MAVIKTVLLAVMAVLLFQISAAPAPVVALSIPSVPPSGPLPPRSYDVDIDTPVDTSDPNKRVFTGSISLLPPICSYCGASFRYVPSPSYDPRTTSLSYRAVGTADRAATIWVFTSEGCGLPESHAHCIDIFGANFCHSLFPPFGRSVYTEGTKHASCTAENLCRGACYFEVEVWTQADVPKNVSVTVTETTTCTPPSCSDPLVVGQNTEKVLVQDTKSTFGPFRLGENDIFFTRFDNISVVQPSEDIPWLSVDFFQDTNKSCLPPVSWLFATNYSPFDNDYAIATSKDYALLNPWRDLSWLLQGRYAYSAFPDQSSREWYLAVSSPVATTFQITPWVLTPHNASVAVGEDAVSFSLSPLGEPSFLQIVLPDTVDWQHNFELEVTCPPSVGPGELNVINFDPYILTGSIMDWRSWVIGRAQIRRTEAHNFVVSFPGCALNSRSVYGYPFSRTNTSMTAMVEYSPAQPTGNISCSARAFKADVYMYAEFDETVNAILDVEAGKRMYVAWNVTGIAPRSKIVLHWSADLSDAPPTSPKVGPKEENPYFVSAHGSLMKHQKIPDGDCSEGGSRFDVSILKAPVGSQTLDLAACASRGKARLQLDITVGKNTPLLAPGAVNISVWATIESPLVLTEIVIGQSGTSVSIDSSSSKEFNFLSAAAEGVFVTMRGDHDVTAELAEEFPQQCGKEKSPEQRLCARVWNQVVPRDFTSTFFFPCLRTNATYVLRVTCQQQVRCDFNMSLTSSQWQRRQISLGEPESIVFSGASHDTIFDLELPSNATWEIIGNASSNVNIRSWSCEDVTWGLKLSGSEFRETFDGLQSATTLSFHFFGVSNVVCGLYSLPPVDVDFVVQKVPSSCVPFDSLSQQVPPLQIDFCDGIVPPSQGILPPSDPEVADRHAQQLFGYANATVFEGQLTTYCEERARRAACFRMFEPCNASSGLQTPFECYEDAACHPCGWSLLCQDDLEFCDMESEPDLIEGCRGGTSGLTTTAVLATTTISGASSTGASSTTSTTSVHSTTGAAATSATASTGTGQQVSGASSPTAVNSTASASSGDSTGLAAGGVIGIILALVFVIAIGVAFYVHYRNGASDEHKSEEGHSSSDHDSSSSSESSGPSESSESLESVAVSSSDDGSSDSTT